jgi:hypothetical protein
MRRRDLLRAGGALGAGLALGRSAWAAPWGQAPAGREGLLLPEGVRAESMLEVFLYGGMSTWEGFYVNPEYGKPDDPNPALRNQQWYLFDRDHGSVFRDNCGLDESEWLVPWLSDSAGNLIHLGPLVAPFRNRPDLLARMRVVVMSHDLEPHEAAIPLGLSGFRLGNPRLCGMGAHIQRYLLDRDSTGRVIPYSYVFTPDGAFFTDNLQAADTVGLHPGSARPLRIKVGDSYDLPTQLERGVLGDAAPQVDALHAWYRSRMATRYSTGGVPIRSRALTDHDFALEVLANVDALKTVIDEDLLLPFASTYCKDTSTNLTGMSIEAAVQLLTHPDTPAGYCNVIDGGLIMADGGGAFDTHFSHLQTQARNANATLQELANRINEPGEGDPAKLDLDKTVVYLSSEFGRTPYLQGGGNGTNHFPYGYVSVILGGPITSDESGIVGSIGPDGVAVDYVTPSDVRVALLASMGIYPFTHESFAVGDVTGASDEELALIWATEHILGRTL